MLLFGAPIRSNSTLQFGGETYIYESPRGGNPNISPETILSAGDFTLAPNQDVNQDNMITDADHQVFVNQKLGVAATLVPVPNCILPSADPKFYSFNGLVRDGRTTPDTMGITRSIPYLDPPVE